jgi:hypothetical protein
MAESRRVELAVGPDEGFRKIQAAVASVGKVEDANPTTRSLVGKVRYGLNPVRVRISVLSGPADGTSVVEIGGKGQDIWGAAARKATDKSSPPCADPAACNRIAS